MDHALTFPEHAASRSHRFLSRSRGITILGLASALVVVIGILDYALGAEVSLLTLYWIPVALAAWYVGSRSGYLFATIGVVVSMGTDRLDGIVYSHASVLLWVFASRLIRISVFVALLGRLRDAFAAEQALRKAKEKEAKLRSDALSLISHEIINSVTIMKIELDDLMMSDADGTKDLRQSLATMRRVLENMHLAASNFVNEARLRCGEFVSEMRPVEIGRVIERTVEALRPLADHKHLTLLLEQAEPGLTAMTDEDALALIINNLVGNAIKYTPPRGDVSIHLATAEPGYVRIAVKDSGIGISPRDRERLIRDSVRLPDGKAMAKGFGIGLKVVRDLLEKHGSALEIDSTPGRGSCFQFRLPETAANQTVLLTSKNDYLPPANAQPLPSACAPRTFGDPPAATGG